MKWGRIPKTKEKEWILREYANLSADNKSSLTILVYDDRDDGYGWRVWKGKTFGNRKGRYWSFESRAKALTFAETLKV